MELIPDIFKPNLNTNQQEERKAPAEFHLVGSEKKVKGHILFSFNTVTKELKQADISREVSIGLDGQPIFNTKTQIEKDCVYIQALNASNARKKLKKLYVL